VTLLASMTCINPVATMQSIEHTLRAFEDFADQDRNRIERSEKALAEYQAHPEMAFEPEDRLKEFLARRAQPNTSLDLTREKTTLCRIMKVTKSQDL
jgi:hypothetical protein